MNYLWEVYLKARQQGRDENRLRFTMAKEYSPYMEVSCPLLNQDRVEPGETVEVNPYYRFYDIFKDLCHPEMQEYTKLRESVTSLVLHQLAANDAVSGMTREEYYKKLLYQDLVSGAYGEQARETAGMFTRQERETVLSGLLRQYQTGSSLDIFKDMMEALVPDNIVYQSNENFHEIFVYVGGRKTGKSEARMKFLVQMFVDLPYHVDIYYEHHFGIIGVEETMRTGEITLC